MSGWAAVLFAVLPYEPHPMRVDICEINHVVNMTTGQESLVQVVWWDWSPWHGAYRVRDWRLLEKCCRPHSEGGKLVQRWYDDGQRRLIIVESGAFRETWTFYDVELEDRKELPERLRRKMHK